MAKLGGKIALVTGAGSGIGRAIADLFAREGASIGVVDLDAAKAAGRRPRRSPGTACRTAGVAADVGDEPAVKAAFGAIVAALGEMDILVNNAGMDTTSPVEDMPTAMLDDMIRVNLRSTFLCTREVLPAMRRKGWGRIINLSSQLAHKGGPTMAHYCAAKAGIIGFTKSLAYELAGDGITVNSISPGPIDTPLSEGAAPGVARDEDQGAADRPFRPARGGRAGGTPARLRGGAPTSSARRST